MRKRSKSESELENLCNLGPVSARWLEAVGIRSEAELREIGAIEAFRRVAMNRAGDVSMNLLYALDGALRGVRWDKLPPDIRVELREAANTPPE